MKRILLRLSLLLLVPLLLGVVVAGWMLGSTAGASLVLSAAGLKATGLEGRLAGPLRAESIEYSKPHIYVSVERAEFDWSPLGLFARRLQVTSLRADSITIATPPSKERAKLPSALKPPLTIRVERADVKRVRFGALAEPGKWTPGFEMTEVALSSVAGGTDWVFESAGATTAAGRVDVKGSVGALNPFPLDVTAQLTGDREGRRYRISAVAKGTLAKFEARVRGEEGGVSGEGVADLELFESQPLRRVRGKLSGIDAKAFVAGSPRTDATMEADLAATPAGHLAGTVRFANAAAGSIDRGLLPVTRAQGELLVAGKRFELTRATIGLAGGGSAVGDVRIDGARVDAKVVATNLDLAAWHASLKPTKLSGNIVAGASGEIVTFEVALTEPRFAISGRATLEGERLTVHEARAERASSVASFQGSLALKGKREFEASGAFERADLSLFANVPASELNAKFSARGTLEPAPAGELSLELGESKLSGLPLSGSANVAGTANHIARADVKLALGDARIQAQGAFGRPGDVLEVTASAADLAPIGRALKLEIGGAINAEARLSGTFAAPAGRISATGEKLVLPAGFAAAAAKLRFELGPEADAKVDAALELTKLTRRSGGLAETIAETAALAAQGTRSRHRITLRAQATQPQPLTLALEGGFGEKAAARTWKGRIESFAMRGPNSVALVAPAALTVSRELVEMGEASLKGEWGEAKLALTRWTPARIELRGSSEGLVTRPLVRSLGLPSAPRSNLVLAAQWDVRATETLDGFVRMKRVRGDVRLGEPAVALEIEEFDASVEAVRGRVSAALAVRGKQVGRISAKMATDIRKEGDAWSLPRESPLAGEIDADLPTLAWASDWLGSEAKLEGKARGKVAIAGTLGAPTWKGDVSATGVKLRDASLGFEIDEGNAAFALDGRQIRIERFELSSAWRPSRRADRRIEGVTGPRNGTIKAEGSLDLGARSGTIVIRSSAYPVTQLSTRFIAATGEARLQGREGALTVTGAFKADAGWFGVAESAPPSISDDVLVDRGEGPPAARGRQRLTLDLRFDLGPHLYFAGRGLATRLAGDLRLRGEPGRNLVATGSIRTEGGTYDAYGQKLSIERGVLNFQGALDNPALNVLAVRGGLPVVAGVEILGSVARPRVRLYSAPEVPDHEKLSWLVLGRGPSQASEGDVATLIAAANALLGTNRENRRVLRNFGVDEIRVGRGDSGSALGALPQNTVAGRTGSTSGAEALTLGKRLTKDIYVSYQQSLADAEATLRFTYQVTQKFHLLLIAGSKPGMDAVYRFTFD